jgi:hypothetical protein
MATDPLIPLPTLLPNHQVKDRDMEDLHLRELTILQRDPLAATLTALHLQVP